jgi:hypothetical protein
MARFVQKKTMLLETQQNNTLPFMARFVLMTGHQKDIMCYIEFGLCAHNLTTNLKFSY